MVMETQFYLKSEDLMKNVFCISIITLLLTVSTAGAHSLWLNCFDATGILSNIFIHLTGVPLPLHPAGEKCVTITNFQRAMRPDQYPVFFISTGFELPMTALFHFS